MEKVAVIVAPGFEEGETLTIVDIICRANIRCDLIGFADEVSGAHDIVVKTDGILNGNVADYDMIVLPGGMPGATNLRDSDELMEILVRMNENRAYIAAMCAAPIALDRAGILRGKNYTAYVGYDQKIAEGNYLSDIVVVDDNVVTSRGPATAYAFAYKLVDLLGGDSRSVKERMVYFNAFDEKEEQ